jgi:hypothetical protein
MSNEVPKLLATATAVATVAAILNWQPAEARGVGARGSRGAVGGYSRQGAYGKSAGIGGYAYGHGAASAVGGSWTGPNGGTAKGGRVGAWKKGYGGFMGSQMSATGAGGSTYNGYRRGKYNAQTGQGTYSSGKDVYHAQTGQSYGYDQNTAYTKGQGATTTLDTQNKGDYTIDWQKGAKPVVTPVPVQ